MAGATPVRSDAGRTRREGQESVVAESVVAQRIVAERLMAERVLATGTVKWFNAEGSGVISPDEGDDDIFVRSSFGTLTEGTRVEFEVDEGPDGLEAFSVVRIGARAQVPRAVQPRPAPPRPRGHAPRY
jgi:CspA family cold shock protein